MSLFHIAATEEYRNRVIQLGEDPKRVYNLGALGAENCTKIAELVNNKTIQGIVDMRDLSNDRNGIRIEIELKKEAQPEVVLNQL